MAMARMKLRPHHLLDIVTQHGAGGEFRPHAYGHAVHTCAEIVLNDVGTEVEFIVGADFICEPCKHLVGGLCDDVLSQLDPPTSKQEYNDDLDRRVLAHLGMQEGEAMTARAFLTRVAEHFEGLPEVCTHPKQAVAYRASNLRGGLEKLGIKKGTGTI
jgi:hypothetical protein